MAPRSEEIASAKTSPAADALGQEIARYTPTPGRRVIGVVGNPRRRRVGVLDSGRALPVVGSSWSEIDRHPVGARFGIPPDSTIDHRGGSQRIQVGLLGALVPEVGFGSLLNGSLAQLLGGHHPGNSGSWIVEVAGHDRLLGAHHHTCRFDAYFDAVHAVVALLRRVLIRVDVKGSRRDRPACMTYTRCSDWCRNQRCRQNVC